MAVGVERRGDLGVGVLVEQAVQQRERVGVGLSQVPRAGWDRDGEAGGLPAAEANVDVDLVGLVERDVFDQQADDAFAFALRSARVGPELGEVGGELTDPGLVLVGELGVRCGAGVFVVVLGGLELAERVVPVGFEGVGDEAVVGIDRQVAAAAELGAMPGALDVVARSPSASSARASSSACTVRATSRASGVTVWSSSRLIASSTPSPGTLRQRVRGVLDALAQALVVGDSWPRRW